jgi:hypothetical protein
MDVSLRSDENLLSFIGSSSSREHGSTVLNLVLQAAEIFSGMEATVRETEARAQSIRKSSDEKVQLVEKRIQVAERARREVTDQAEHKLREASKALKQAQSRITAAEDLLTALEFRAQSAEAQLCDAKQTLLQVELAIRERFLNAESATARAQDDLAVAHSTGA